jgi:hypothetical protein
MVDIEQLRTDVESALNTVEYNPDNKETNIRIVEDIRSAINKLADGEIPSPQHIAEVAVATNENIQIRDFLMGVQLESNIDYVGTYVNLLGNVIKKDKVIPLATVFCGLLYQENEKEQAKEFLSTVLELAPEYSLALLLKQVFAADWEPENLEHMAKQLHPKVIETIYETAEAK